MGGAVRLETNFTVIDDVVIAQSRKFVTQKVLCSKNLTAGKSCRTVRWKTYVTLTDDTIINYQMKLITKYLFFLQRILLWNSDHVQLLQLKLI